MKYREQNKHQRGKRKKKKWTIVQIMQKRIITYIKEIQTMAL